jgi:riboflavin synthase
VIYIFTGIIEEMGVVKHLTIKEPSGELTVSANKVLEGTKVGDSIAVNGICLTVTSLQRDGFTADVMAETFRRSSLKQCKTGTKVNLERAMAADGRFGGHIVSGHIDGTGTILSNRKEGNAVWVKIQTTPQILQLIVEKGSISIDGISLTVAELADDNFSVSVIPHTGAETTLLQKKAGDLVNLENDVIGKYVERLLGVEGDRTKQATESKGITMEFLEEYGI